MPCRKKKKQMKNVKKNKLKILKKDHGETGARWVGDL